MELRAAGFAADEPSVRQWLIDSMDGQTSFRSLNHLIASGLVALLLWDRLDSSQLLGWLGLLWIIWMLRLAVHRYPWRQGLDCESRATVSLVFCAVFGCAWAFGAWLFIDGGDAMVTAVMAVTLLGIAAGSSITLAAYPPACFAYVLPSVLGLIAVLFSQAQALGAALGVLAVYALLGDLYSSLAINRELRRNVRLSQENLALRREAESKNELLETTLHNIDQGIALFAADGALRMHNQRFFELLGIAPDAAALRALLAGGDSPREIASDSGDTLELHQRRLASGEQVCTLTDISVLKTRQHQLDRARVEAEQANAAKTRFLAAASHDLRQPIHALGLLHEALVERLGERGPASLLERIGAAIEAVNSMLGALLDISKLDAGVVEPRIQAVDLGALLARLDDEFQAVAAEGGNQLRVRASRQWLRSDALMLERILRNLIGNALRYTRGGRVLVGARRCGDSLRIEVHDSGPGIPAERREEIFLEFHQLGNPQRDRRQGLGLGLAIARRLAALLDHSLELRSTLGRGSVFSVVAPRCVVASGDVVAAKQQRPGDFLRGHRALVIDDDFDIRTAMRELLQGWGMQVSIAADAAEAGAQAAAAAPDVLVVDYRLAAGADGIAVIAELRRQLGAPTPALLLTGDTAPERLQQARDSGLPLLHKPLRPASLRIALRQLLRAT